MNQVINNQRHRTSVMKIHDTNRILSHSSLFVQSTPHHSVKLHNIFNKLITSLRGIELEPHPKQTPIVRFQSTAQEQPPNPASSLPPQIDPLDSTLNVCVWSKRFYCFFKREFSHLLETIFEPSADGSKQLR